MCKGFDQIKANDDYKAWIMSLEICRLDKSKVNNNK